MTETLLPSAAAVLPVHDSQFKTTHPLDINLTGNGEKSFGLSLITMHFICNLIGFLEHKMADDFFQILQLIQNHQKDTF